jgi:hypothetical protein
MQSPTLEQATEFSVASFCAVSLGASSVGLPQVPSDTPSATGRAASGKSLPPTATHDAVGRQVIPFNCVDGHTVRSFTV